MQIGWTAYEDITRTMRRMSGLNEPEALSQMYSKWKRLKKDVRITDSNYIFR